MKTYEEMARDVLKRRDEELLKMQQTTYNAPPETVYPAIPKKRGLVPKIVIPCTAAVTAAAVGIGIWNKTPEEKYINNGVVNAEDSYYFNPLVGEGDKFNESEYIAASYKGGKTEINFNDRTDVYHTIWCLNSPAPDLVIDDFIGIPDNEINNFYMIEFDRLTRCYPDWQSEHSPFGYYSRDEESDGIVSHAVHGYYSENSICYYAAENGGKVNVTASWMKYSLNDSDDKVSLLNGFGAYVYKDGQRNYRAEIDMGAHVTIYAENLTEEDFINTLKEYTAPPKGSETETLENKINIYVTRPDCLEKHIFYNGRCLTEDVSQVLLTKNELNAVYDMEFDRFGRLHPDWNENVSVYPRVFVSDYENTESNVQTIGRRKVVAANNRIEYYMTADEDLPWLSVHADLIGVAEDSFSPFDGSHGASENISIINGKKALIWVNGSDRAFSAVIEMGKTLVEISSGGLSIDEFFNALDEYTAENPKSDAKEKDVVKILDALPEEIILPNADRPQSDDYTFVAHNKAQLSDFYGMEFDCLGKLHKDWEEVTENDLGILVYGDEKVTADVAYPGGDRENVWSQNTIKYRISDKSGVTVTAMLGDLNPPLDYYVFGYITGGGTDNVSLINGRYALIWRGNEGSSQLAAAMRMGRSTVIIQAEGLSDAEFTDVLKEYAASTTNDNVSRRIPCKYYNTADFVDDRINYAVKLTEKKILFSKKTDIEQTAQTEGSAAALGYFKEFFQSDDLPVDAAYNDNWVRYVYDAKFECAVEPNTTVCSPVNGKVIAASDCNGDLGKTVAVEFVNRVFILSNLEEVNVKPGDEITAGQVLGIGGAADDQAPRLTMTLMTITDDRA